MASTITSQSFFIFSTSISALILLLIQDGYLAENGCSFLKQPATGTVDECNKLPWSEVTSNLPLIGGAYCFNDGSGTCKAFAGRYEFYYNSFNDTFLRSAPQSEYVDKFGYHMRVPVAYTINGDMMYADQSINWARKFAANEWKGKNISLMSIDVLNWCAFVAGNHWPYKSAIKSEQYQIYFYNRQSCIVDTSTSAQPKQHFNTRFLHNSSVRIDLDMNPTIYAMEDYEAKEIRLVKHKRQHWYEVPFKVVKKPKENLDYFVDMNPTEKRPCKICGDRPILPNTTYRAISNVCLSDFFHDRGGSNNARLVTEFCGLDMTEIADYPKVLFEQAKGYVLEVDLHNIPRRPKTTTNFFGIYIRDDSDWLIWAKDGLTFSAATTIPTNDNMEVRVILLYAKFQLGVNAPKYEEYDPMPYLADYKAKFVPSSADPREGDWKYDINSAQIEAKNLNYVDDIAYLYKCDSLLVIFGPFYSELPVDKKIDLNTKGPANSIYELGIWEPANAFFAMPDDTNVLWVYYRTNYIAEHRYECGKPLVTATRSSAYLTRHGPDQPPFFEVWWTSKPEFKVSEETLFQHIGAYQGDLSSVEPPDPKLYDGKYIPAPSPLEGSNQTYIYIIIAVGVLIIVTMCIICMIAIRRRAKRRRHLKTLRSGNLENESRPEKSTRSLLSSWLPFGGTSALNKTKRSSMSKHSPSSRRSSTQPSTVRSTRTATPTNHVATTRSTPGSHKTKRSSMSNHGPSSRRSSTQPGTVRSVRTATPTKASATTRSPSLNSNQKQYHKL